MITSNNYLNSALLLLHVDYSNLLFFLNKFNNNTYTVLKRIHYKKAYLIVIPFIFQN